MPFLKKEYDIPLHGRSASGSGFLFTGAGGEWYAYLVSNQQAYRLDSRDKIIDSVILSTDSEIGNNTSQQMQPSDIIMGGGLQILLVDPWFTSIARFSRRLEQRSALKLQATANRFEPVSICTVSDGTLFILNRSDQELWHANSDGVLTSKGAGSSRSDWLDTPLQVRFAENLRRLIILDKNSLKICDSFGNLLRKITLNLKAPERLTVFNDEVWVLGDGIEYINLKTSSQRIAAPVASLESWGAFPPADVMMRDGEFIYLLPQSCEKVIKLRIIRVPQTE